ncbi:MAG: peptidoglycan bridge formation glycyltransferase FemA/FemB family protein, partial [Candidatus Limnocylindrales bacterium]
GAAEGCYLVVARAEGREVAGMVVPRLGDRAYYVHGASRRTGGTRDAYGSYAAMAALFRRLASDGVRVLDLWGVTEPGDSDADPAWAGFSAFKRQFGGRPLRHPGTFDLVVSPSWYALRDLGERLRGG